MIEYRDYQIVNANKMIDILKKYNIVYLAAEVRTGKTLTSLLTADLLNVKNVLFITKKKAKESILKDYFSNNFKFVLNVINYEQAVKVTESYDLIIVDEAHNLGAFPKPSLRTKIIKISRRCYNLFSKYKLHKFKMP
jgi:superfamily II DNA or RNA helicase